MASIHGHEVLHMILSSKSGVYAKDHLSRQFINVLGKKRAFHTCSAENMTAAELVAFLEKKENLLLLMAVLLPVKTKFVAISNINK